MTSITVENVSLTFPLFTKSVSTTAGHTSATPDARLIKSPQGRILGVRALENISFTLKGGDRLALLGHNGSGKTTLLQILAGIMAPDKGKVTIEGTSTNLININLGAQLEATGHRNITLRGLASGHSLEMIEAKRAEIVAFSELDEFLDMPVETYSAGMRMRLSFAIATAFEPEILILDEWLSAGDNAFKQKATERMQTFVERAGILVMASHSSKLLLDNCNYAIWLENGKIRAQGETEELLNAYQEHTLLAP